MDKYQTTLDGMLDNMFEYSYIYRDNINQDD